MAKAKPAATAKAPAASSSASSSGGRNLRPSTGSTGRAQTLLESYQNNLSGGAASGRTPQFGANDDALGDYAAGARASWNVEAPLRQYGDRLRAQSRDHEKDLLGMQGKQQLAGIHAQQGNERALARMSDGTTRYTANLAAGTQKYMGMLEQGNVREQVRGGVDQARIGANAQIRGAELGLEGDRYRADTDYKMTIRQQEGENYRTSVRVGADLLINQDNNRTAESGQLFDYAARIRATQWRAPNTSDIRYWGN